MDIRYIFDKYKGLVVLGLAVLLLVILWSLVNRFIIFNIVDSPSNVSSTTTIFEYKFNKQLEPLGGKASDHVVINQNIDKVVKVEGKTLFVYLERPADLDSELKIELKNIQSQSGSTKDQTFTYQIKYKPTSELSPEELAATTQRSNSFEKDFPLMNKLPLISSQYEITSRFPEGDSNKMPIVINCLTRNPAPSNIQGDPIPLTANDPDVAIYLNEIKACRDAAMQELRRIEFNTDRYELRCGEDALLKEYGCIYDNYLGSGE